MTDFSDLDTAASPMAGRIDELFFTLTGVTVVVVCVIVGLIVYFCLRYRATNETVDRTHRVTRSRTLELTWVLGPLAVFLGLFAWGAVLYADLYKPPADAKVIYVVGKQWMWQLQHPEGRRERNELHVPVGQPIRLVLTSEDVIHSFYVPALRIKQDAVPGLYTTLWFTPTVTGRFKLFCAEYCGTDHAGMQGGVTVMEPDAYAQWIAQGPSMAERGRQILADSGCTDCHSGRGTVRAPALESLLGSTVHLDDGRYVEADAAYVRQSVFEPAKAARDGFDATIMPSYEGQLDELDLLMLDEYMRPPAPAENGS